MQQRVFGAERSMASRPGLSQCTLLQARPTCRGVGRTFDPALEPTGRRANSSGGAATSSGT